MRRVVLEECLPGSEGAILLADLCALETCESELHDIAIDERVFVTPEKGIYLRLGRMGSKKRSVFAHFVCMQLAKAADEGEGTAVLFKNRLKDNKAFVAARITDPSFGQFVVLLTKA